jgi:hypothetical protein
MVGILLNISIESYHPLDGSPILKSYYVIPLKKFSLEERLILYRLFAGKII